MAHVLVNKEKGEIVDVTGCNWTALNQETGDVVSGQNSIAVESPCHSDPPEGPEWLVFYHPASQGEWEEFLAVLREHGWESRVMWACDSCRRYFEELVTVNHKLIDHCMNVCPDCATDLVQSGDYEYRR